MNEDQNALEEYPVPIRGTRPVGTLLFTLGLIQLLFVFSLTTLTSGIFLLSFFFIGFLSFIPGFFTITLGYGLRKSVNMDKDPMKRSELIVWAALAFSAIVISIVVSFYVYTTIYTPSSSASPNAFIINGIIYNPFVYNLPLWIVAIIFFLIPALKKKA